ncbi:MAG: class I SAM-dependent methyltransferase [Gammaproteobacteria bacterium]|nr:class I SAM-dependent methyltransferase [Gammaproteobacteria bacterium]
MSCCCPHSHSAGRLFSFFARYYRRRFEKKGLEASQKQLMAGLEMAGYQDCTVLDVGSGVGYIHQTLLEQGAASAVGIDLSTEMIKESRAWAEQRGLVDRTNYLVGDFIYQAELIDVADICILDKVVCCYPDAESLINLTLDKTSKIFALTYPRNKWYVRLATGMAAVFLKVLRSEFRPYVHDRLLIEQWIADQGYSKVYENRTIVWLTQVYKR